MVQTSGFPQVPSSSQLAECMEVGHVRTAALTTKSLYTLCGKKNQPYVNKEFLN
jgi:hypothetical protein